MRDLPDGYVACAYCSWAGPLERYKGHFERQHGGLKPMPLVEEVVPKVVPRKSSARKLNKTEERFLRLFNENRTDYITILPQALVLPLDGGGTYHPDFMIVTVPEGALCPRVRLIETKGGYRGPGWEQGVERYRRARLEWGKFFKFEMWTWNRKTQQWEVEQ